MGFEPAFREVWGCLLAAGVTNDNDVYDFIAFLVLE